MIIPTITNPAPANGVNHAAANAADAGDTAATMDFATLLGAGTALPADPPSANATPAKESDDAGKEAAACDPATLLAAIAAGQAGVDAQSAASANAAAAHIVPLHPVPPGAQADAREERVTGADPRMHRETKPGAGADQAAGPTLGVAMPGADDTRSAHGADTATDDPAPATQVAPKPAAGLLMKAESAEPRLHAPAPPLPAASSPLPAHAAPQPPTGAVAHLEQLAQPLGSKGWEDGFASRIVWMAKNDVQSASIHLNPPDLGPVEVKLTLTSDAGSAPTATVQFSAAHATTRDAIESALPRLHEMLRENGIALGNTSVDAGASGGASAFADAGRHPRGAAGQQAGNDASQAEPLPAARQSTITRRGNGLVDTFA